MFHRLSQLLKDCLPSLLCYLENQLKRWTQPATESLAIGIVTDLTPSRSDLIAENAFLRQQRIILKRQTHRPSLTSRDRGWLVAMFT